PAATSRAPGTPRPGCVRRPGRPPAPPEVPAAARRAPRPWQHPRESAIPEQVARSWGREPLSRAARHRVSASSLLPAGARRTGVPAACTTIRHSSPVPAHPHEVDPAGDRRPRGGIALPRAPQAALKGGELVTMTRSQSGERIILMANMDPAGPARGEEGRSRPSWLVPVVIIVAALLAVGAVYVARSDESEHAAQEQTSA